MGRRVSLWHLAGRVYHEAILQGQMLAAGSNVTRLTARMSRDARYISKQGRTIQVLGSFYLLMVAFVSVTAFLELRSEGASAWDVLVASGSIGVQLFIQTGYLIMLTVLATAEILAPDLYRWLESLPFSRGELGSLRILALGREFAMPLGVILVSTPLVAGLAGGSLPAGLVGVLVGIEHAGVTLGLAVLVSWRMRRALRGSDGDDRRARIARIVTMVVYGVGTLLVVFIMQISTNVLVRLYDSPGLPGEASLRIVRLLSLLPLPTAPAVLLVSIAAGSAALPIGLPLAGTFLYGVLAVVLLARVRALLLGSGDGAGGRSDPARSSPTADPTDPVGLARRPLRVSTARSAFRRQIRSAMGRDTQVLVAIIFPLILPLLGSVGPALSGSPSGFPAAMGIVMAAVGGGWMVIHGMTRLQFGSGGLEATLPIRERDRVVPRLRIAAVLPALGAVLPSLVLLPIGSAEQVDSLVQGLCVAVVAPAGLLLKVALFGRVSSGSNPYVLDEVHTTGRVPKWIAVVGLLGILAAAILVGYPVLRGAFGRWAYLLLPAGAAIVGAGELLVARRMFP